MLTAATQTAGNADLELVAEAEQRVPLPGSLTKLSLHNISRRWGGRRAAAQCYHSLLVSWQCHGRPAISSTSSFGLLYMVVEQIPLWRRASAPTVNCTCADGGWAV